MSMKSTRQPAIVDERSSKTDWGNCHRDDSDGEQTAENSASNNRALTSIQDLLETRISIDNEDRQKNAKDAKTRRDWMVAAAVIDRLCFIVLLIVFIGGTILFLLLFLRS